MSNNLREALVGMMPQQKQAFMSGIVIEVDQVNCTCNIDPDNGDSTFFDVRLRSQINENNSGIVIFPKLNSSVIFGMIDENSACVLLCTEIEKVTILGGKMNLTANIEADGGISLSVLGVVSMSMGSGGLSFSTSENINLQGKDYAESAENITSHASSENTVQSDGNMNVTGQTTNINASGNTNINASSQIVLAGGGDFVATANRLVTVVNNLITQINAMAVFMNVHVHAAFATPPAPLFTLPPLIPISNGNISTSKVRIP